MAVPFVQTSFAAGELTPSLFGHVDLAKFAIAASTLRNLFVSYRGGAYSRAGTAFVGFSKQTGRAVPPRVITFQFSINQGLMLEFGNRYMRVVKNGQFVTETPINITNITLANPGVITVPGHGYSNGDWVFLSGIGGMTQLNGRTLLVANATVNNFMLTDVYGVPISTTTFGAYTTGGTAARIYTLTTPYAEADLGYLKFTQSADVMSICCWNQITGTSYPPNDLSRLADNNWTLTPSTFQASIAAPTGTSVTGTPTTASTPVASYGYVATAVSAATGEESIASPVAYAFNVIDIAASAGSNQIKCSAVAGAGSYNVYRAPNNAAQAGGTAVPPLPGALFGFVGTSVGPQFVDSNIVPSFQQVPPTDRNPFAPGAILGGTITANGSGYTSWSGTALVGSITLTINTATGTGAVLAGLTDLGTGALIGVIVVHPGQNYLPADTVTVSGSGTGATMTLSVGPATGVYPSAVTYFQQRRIYAATPNQPQTYFMSQPGLFSNFSSRVPTIASDAIIGTPWSVQVNGIQFMVSMPGGLVVLTGLSAWQLTGTGGSSLNPQPITPASQQAQPQAYNGCSSTVPPIKIDYDILYVQAKGSIVRDLAYNFFVNIYTGIDLTLLSSHLFLGYTIREWAWCEEPYKIIWAVRNDGILLSLTYLKQQDVSAWARHDTNGLFQSVCAVTEPPVDALYAAVQRFPGGNTAYMIERMDNRIWPSVQQCWCVDAGLALPQPGPAATLSASSATGLGSITGSTGLVGGANYSALTTAAVVDLNGKGPGQGAVPVLTIVGGVITAVTFPPGNQGQGYVSPALVITDPSGMGAGASASLILNNTAMFFASAGVFSAGSVGSVIRAGGGIATVTQFVSTTEVLGNITQPITAMVPNSGGAVIPQPAGSWTITQPTATISGLQHLAGATVTGLADGAVIPPTVVSPQGTIALPQSASAVTVGLGFQAQLQSVYLNAGNPTVQGQRKKIAAVTARVEASLGFTIGSNQPDGSTLSPAQLAPVWTGMTPAPPPSTAPGPPFGSNVIPLFTGDIRVPVTGGFAKPGQVALQQSLPLPLQVLALIPEVLPGDIPETEAKRPDRQEQMRRAA